MIVRRFLLCFGKPPGEPGFFDRTRSGNGTTGIPGKGIPEKDRFFHGSPPGQTATVWTRSEVNRHSTNREEGSPVRPQYFADARQVLLVRFGSRSELGSDYYCHLGCSLLSSSKNKRKNGKYVTDGEHTPNNEDLQTKMHADADWIIQDDGEERRSPSFSARSLPWMYFPSTPTAWSAERKTGRPLFSKASAI
jgi:hypothetical protein